MSLPPLLRHVYNHGNEEVIRRGKKIFYNSGVSLLDVDHFQEQIRFRVRNDLYQNYYTVTINRFMQAEQLSLRCQCPYNLGEICRHEVAALFQLNDMVLSGYFDNISVSYDQKHTIVRLRQVNESILRVFCSPQSMEKALSWSKVKKAMITTNQNNMVSAEIHDEDSVYKVTIKQNDERYFDTSCNCVETAHPLCVHKTTLFLQILNTFGAGYFQAMRNWDEQKNKLLSLYGYSLNDDLTGKFAFTYEQGKPFLRVLDPTIKKVAATGSSPYPALQKTTFNEGTPENTGTLVETARAARNIGIVINTHSDLYPFMETLLIEGECNTEDTAFVSAVDKLELQQYINATRYKENQRDLIPLVRKLMPDEILKYLRKNLPFGEFYDDYTKVLGEDAATDVLDQVREYLVPKYRKLVERFADYSLIYLKTKGKALKRNDLSPIQFCSNPVHPRLVVEKKKSDYQVQLQWILEGSYVPYNDVEVLGSMLIVYNNKIYALEKLHEVKIAELFAQSKGLIKVKNKDWSTYLDENILPWSKIVATEFSDNMVSYSKDVMPQYRLHLSEMDNVFVLRPMFVYQNTEIRSSHQGDVTSSQDGTIHIIERNTDSEQYFLRHLRELHANIQYNLKEQYFYLPSNLVLSKNWFFKFTELMTQLNVEMLGMEQMKHLRISTLKPDTKLQLSSGIDWFDAMLDITFGDQKVTVSDVKKALLQKKNYVQLADGSLGLLPEEWLNKYALMLKMGEYKNGKLRVKKIHFSVLDELVADVNDQKIYDELEEKKESLAQIISNDFSLVNPTDELKERLRPYQLAGFQWLVFLKEAGWGGLLADDMGLGKTVQTLSFLQYFRQEHSKAKFLVVCPTSLIYNWQREIEKFAPELSYHVHHGTKRMLNIDKLEDINIIITSYGTMRSDIKQLKEIDFDVIALDESQSIKNPQSQVTKAANLLQGKLRLALSGTPLQNNTFDLYAQMNFLNPGLLGSREFYMSEFANPIDKMQDGDVKQQLKKLTYPFLLRRTKEQVAKDLPEKTESIIYCEMGKEQRKIYDAYRNQYRTQIMTMIEEKGMERSHLHVLQGLTKLRQICDSPSILNEEDRFENYSVKIDELTRQLTENTGEHKVLIFSQFLGMLDLIRRKLEELSIKYVYFDGSTSTADRESAIKEFQTEEECRVFLISLKAGGVGLNLTAADYVYIVDPWWNPAVEQQAIDRTHRIGQTKNIFAYRLICTDTIEEKMIVLQERKRALAGEIIGEDSAMMKRLTKEDISYLLS